MTDSTPDNDFKGSGSNMSAGEHASISDLVAMRDGERPTAHAHVAQCVFCQTRLEEVYSSAKSLQDALIFEAELPVPANVWANLQEHLQAQPNSHNGVEGSSDDQVVSTGLLQTQLAGQKPSFWTSVNSAIYSLAAAVMFTGMVSLYTFHGQQDSRVQSQALQASIQSLMDNSRGLESVLQQVAAQNSALTLSDQSAAERLQWRLMLVDQQIHESESSDDASYEQIKALWAARIDALTELNQLYYTNQVAVESGHF